MKNKSDAIDTNITLETKTRVRDVIALSIDKVGAKKVLDIILSQCLSETLERVASPLPTLLANEKDEEKADATAALYYLKKNWKECSDKGMKLLRNAICRHEKSKSIPNSNGQKKDSNERNCGNCLAQSDPNMDCGKCKDQNKWKKGQI